MDEKRDQASSEQVVEIPLTTKAGIIALPSLLTLGIDAFAHLGATPPALVAFFTVMLAANSSKLAEVAGKNKQLLVALSTHDEWRQRLDRMSDGHFTRQIRKLQKERPDLFEVGEAPQRMEERTLESVATKPAIEDLQPARRQDAPATRAIIGPNPARRLILADNFQPDAQEVLSTGVVAFGIPGSGKTTVLVRFLEQYIKKFGLPLLAFDSQGDFLSLINACPNGVIATPDNMPSMEEIIYDRLQVIVNLDEWREDDANGQKKAAMSHELAAQEMAADIFDLMAVQKRIEPGKRIPCLVSIDEIHLWTPQDGKPTYLSSQAYGDMLNAMIALATTGRKLGTVPFLATQRIAKVNKDVIGGMETRIFGKVSLDNDVKRYREYFQGVVTDEQIKQFGKGEMVACMSGEPLYVQFHNRETVHVSHTPRISQALKPITEKHTESLPSMPPASRERHTDDLPATPRYARPSAYDAHLQRKYSQRESRRDFARARMEQQAPVTEDLPAQDPELERTYQLWTNGHGSVRALASAAGKTYYQANQLYTKMVEAGMIEAKR